MNEPILWPARSLPATDTYDVVVCGGGPAGCAAALAAARQGLKALVVEGQGQLGGMGTSGLVSHWLGGCANDCRRWVVGGIFKDLALADYANRAGSAGFRWLEEIQELMRQGEWPFTYNRLISVQLTEPDTYRIMLPQGISNLICPGRAVSVARDVLGPLRVMAPCMAMGEAAGVAAAQVVRCGTTYHAVDTAVLQEALRRQGAILEMASSRPAAG